MSEHLLVCDKSKSISFEYCGLFPISFSNSLATTVIVDRGVPNEWAAAAALLGAFAYMVLTGATVPTQRAFLMLALMMLAVLVVPVRSTASLY